MAPDAHPHSQHERGRRLLLPLVLTALRNSLLMLAIVVMRVVEAVTRLLSPQRLLREALHVLMEGVPPPVERATARRALAKIALTHSRV